MTIILTEEQRIDSTAYIFAEYEIAQKNNKISTEENQYTLKASMDSDADAMYQILRKLNLTEELNERLKNVKSLEYFNSLPQVIKMGGN